MNQQQFNKTALCVIVLAVLSLPQVSAADELSAADAALLDEITQPANITSKGGMYKSVDGFASYYARRFEGRRTTSGRRYNPEKLTAAHVSLPLGTVVRVVNSVSKQEVDVTVNDRCAPKSYHFIDLSRAAAKKIGLWGKGKIKVVITPLLASKHEEPA